MKNWKARIQIGGKGSSIEVRVQAKSFSDAKKLILAQYAPGTKITSHPVEVR